MADTETQLRELMKADAEYIRELARPQSSQPAEQHKRERRATDDIFRAAENAKRAARRHRLKQRQALEQLTGARDQLRTAQPDNTQLEGA